MKRRPLGESDALLVLLSPGGRLDCVVRGGLKSRRWGGIIEPLSLLEAQFSSGRSFAYLREAQMLSGFSAVREDFDLLSVAGYWIDLCGTFAQPQHDSDYLFKAVVWALKLLGESAPLSALNFWLELKILGSLGLSPVLGACVSCGSESVEAWGSVQGGLECADCRRSGSTSLSPLAITVLRALSRCPAQSLVDLFIPPAESRQIYSAMRCYFMAQASESSRVLHSHAEIGELLWKRPGDDFVFGVRKDDQI